MRIAWIEDDVSIISKVLYPLEHAGAIVDKYCSVSEAEDSVEEVMRADVIILDLRLPPESEPSASEYPGRDLLRKWRSAYTAMPPVIVMTVVTNATVLDDLKSLQIAALINKPVLPSVLAARVHEILADTQGDAANSATGYNFDLFVSYAMIDDSDRWVSQLIEHVQVRLHQLTGISPRIFFDRVHIQPDGVYRDEHQRACRSAALLLAVVSPSFLTSKWCVRELEEFVSDAGASRVVKVAKLPTDGLSPLPQLVEHRFYTRAANNPVRELTPDEEQYDYAVRTLTQQIQLLLSSLKKSIKPTSVSLGSRMAVFLCHSSGDKAAVRNLWERLSGDGLAPWLDEKELQPGQKWELEIRKAIDRAGAIVICLSKDSTNKEGFLQREMKLVIDKASEMPEETIFLIPARLEECSVPFRLREFQWVDLFEDSGYARLLQALHARATALRQRGR